MYDGSYQTEQGRVIGLIVFNNEGSVQTAFPEALPLNGDGLKENYLEFCSIGDDIPGSCGKIAAVMIDVVALTLCIAPVLGSLGQFLCC